MTITRRSVLGGIAGGTALAGLGAVTTESAWATPELARQHGFTRIVLQDDFTSLSTIDLGQTGAPGYTWYGRAPWDMASVRTDDVKILSEGGTTFLRLTPSASTCNWQLGTMDPRTGNGHSFVQGYAEIRMRFHCPPEPNWATVGNHFAWPSFWGVTRENFMTGHGSGLEIDVIEACGGPGTHVGVLHDPRNGQTWSSSNSYHRTGADFSQWHTFGCGWTSGGAAWFLDDQLLMTQSWGANGASPAAVLTGSNGGGAPRDVFTGLDTAQMVFGFGSGIGVPMDVDWARFWGR